MDTRSIGVTGTDISFQPLTDTIFTHTLLTEGTECPNWVSLQHAHHTEEQPDKSSYPQKRTVLGGTMMQKINEELHMIAAERVYHSETSSTLYNSCRTGLALQLSGQESTHRFTMGLANDKQ